LQVFNRSIFGNWAGLQLKSHQLLLAAEKAAISCLLEPSDEWKELEMKLALKYWR